MKSFQTPRLAAREMSLLIVDDDPAVSEIAEIAARKSGFGRVEKTYSMQQGLAALRGGDIDLVLLDLGLPDAPEGGTLSLFLREAGSTPVAVVTADNSLGTAVRCMKEGAYDFIEKPLSPARLMSLFSHAEENMHLNRLLRPSRGQAPAAAFAGIITKSPIMLDLFSAAERLAPSPMQVLIMGESGTGKELLARALHDCSGRTGEFVPVNTAGLDGTLFSDVLFGHSKGAYTGAGAARSGLIKRAEGGTLFLDEIGDISPEIQVKLLRFLQDGEYYPLGTDKPERSNCRMVLATNVNLYDAVQSGTFRADLYYRLIIHLLAIPPLRERIEDIPLLIDHYAALAEKSLNLGSLKIEPAFYETALSYGFPGNIRELSAIVFGAVAASDTRRISLPYLENYIAQHRKKGKQAEGGGCEQEDDGQPFMTLEEVEDRHIREALRRAGGNQTAAASLLGISQSTISRKLRQSDPS